jgi:hypothetical protein
MKTYPKANGHVCKWTFILAFLAALSFPIAIVQAAPLPLPQDLQNKVNRAIENGVENLLNTMGPMGTWSMDKGHDIGYAALPGLTLLECGVSANHPAIQKAALYVRRSAPRADKTYDIALSILFLDKLGNEKDRPIIQMLALRLIAGQSPTGGWSYKCPILNEPTHKRLLALLRKMDPPQFFDPLTGLPDATRNSISRKGLQSQPVFKDLVYLSPQSKGADEKERVGRTSPIGSRNWAWCIKMEDAPVNVSKPTKVVIPQELQPLAVLYPPEKLPVMDPLGKGEQPLWGTTDNSNTQFAILAMWVARRHDVPTDRTLNLIAKRFYTSQNPDGSWGYHYQNGGGNPERPPMTCVGLLGLAVARGLGQDAYAQVPRDQDPWIIKGLLALSKNVGEPRGRMENLPMANLYFLWSVERVAVLFDLPTFGNKDWYRWGAEILVANQKMKGEWDGGMLYYGATPTCDTCLALLFLKKSNLVTDLTSRFSSQSKDLTKVIEINLPSEPTPPKKIEEKSPNRKRLADDLALNNPTGNKENEEPKMKTGLTATTPMARPKPPPIDFDDEGSPSKGMAWFFGLLAFLIIALSVGTVLFARQSMHKDDEDNSQSRASRAKRRLGLSAKKRIHHPEG